MNAQEAGQFRELMQGVHDFYGVEMSEFSLTVWWQAMKPFDYAAVQDALSRHVVNPDQGQFMPKPADAVKLLGGTTKDAAMVAWAKVDRAVREVGPYRSVVFDDAIVHAVLSDMGGWIGLGSVKEDEWPFKANEFVNRYRGYRNRGRFEYPRMLTGIVDHENAQKRLAIQPDVVMVGNRPACEQVLAGGSTRPRLEYTSAAGPLARLVAGQPA